MQSLETIQKDIWTQLSNGQTERQHPFRLGTFSNVGANGVNLRTVVVRKVIEQNAALWLYTDFRSPKVHEIKKNSNIAWLFYNPINSTQVRLYGTAEILHNTSINRYVWEQIPERNRTDYLTTEPSGTIKTGVTTSLLSKDDDKNFCIIKTSIHTIDWLKLGYEEHLRASFKLTIDGEWQKEWLVP